MNHQQTLKELHQFAQAERTEYHIYHYLARREKDPHNRRTLEQLAEEEATHYKLILKESGVSAEPNKTKIFIYTLLARVLGLTFAIKLMETGEHGAVKNYSQFTEYPAIRDLARDEDAHEQKLIALINEERLAYMGSVVLGLSDALVEFTGALAGFTFALRDTKLIALTGAITGIAAALSMASSEYLSSKSEDEGKHPLKAALYTGVAYVFTVAALVSPFALLSNVFVALGVMLAAALLLIAAFSFYYAVARGESFRRRFTEMACLSFGVAGVSFFIGYLLKTLTGIEA